MVVGGCIAAVVVCIEVGAVVDTEVEAEVDTVVVVGIEAVVDIEVVAYIVVEVLVDTAVVVDFCDLESCTEAKECIVVVELGEELLEEVVEYHHQ